MNNQEIEQARNEAFRKIGRNVINFQKFESMLKALMKSSSFHGKASEMAAHVEKRNEWIERQSMGILVGVLFKTVLAKPPEKEFPEEPDELWISVGHVIELKKQDAKHLKHALATIVEERNILIHHLIPDSNFKSMEDCTKLGVQLDDQCEKLKPYFKLFQSFINGRIELHSVLGESIDSGEFESLIAEIRNRN